MQITISSYKDFAADGVQVVTDFKYNEYTLDPVVNWIKEMDEVKPISTPNVHMTFQNFRVVLIIPNELLYKSGWPSEEAANEVLKFYTDNITKHVHKYGSKNADQLIDEAKRKFWNFIKQAAYHEGSTTTYLSADTISANKILSSSWKPMGYVNSVAEELAEMSYDLPGIEGEIDNIPCGCKGPRVYTTGKIMLRDAIIHLNDKERWSREQIADWLDELHDAGIINIEFEVPIDDEDDPVYTGDGGKE